jgi:NTP pyrophosphatase (non-canonical NTP hydrolase)
MPPKELTLVTMDDRLFIPNEYTKNCIKKFGINDQLDHLQEECAELIVAISKVKRKKDYARENLKEEIAHVLMLMVQVMDIEEITERDVKMEVTKSAIRHGIKLKESL